RPAGWAGRIWSPAIRQECLATRDAAGLFDQTSFSKLEISGHQALMRLQRVCAGQLDRAPGSIVYTQLLNERGGIEADLTVTRLAEDRFRLVTGTAFGVHDAAWLRGHGLDVRDVTSAHACYCLWGPRALDILGTLSDDDLTFGYMQAREISVGNVPVLAQRVTFVGEFGWELYCPSEYGLTLWDTLMEAGTPYGMRPAGYRAIDSMRLEKGYRVWGMDITPETTPVEAGLGFAVAKDKDFLGRSALEAAARRTRRDQPGGQDGTDGTDAPADPPDRQQGADGPARRLACLVLDDPRQVCLAGEPVRLGGEPASRVTSGGYGHRVERSIAYAYLPAGTAPGDRAEVGVTGTWVGATVVAEPLYDPASDRIRHLPT
ncbi:aminomethyltransferase family protein, partial [Streptosporangium minutum]